MVNIVSCLDTSEQVLIFVRERPLLIGNSILQEDVGKLRLLIRHLKSHEVMLLIKLSGKTLIGLDADKHSQEFVNSYYTY